MDIIDVEAMSKSRWIYSGYWWRYAIDKAAVVARDRLIINDILNRNLIIEGKFYKVFEWTFIKLKDFQDSNCWSLKSSMNN